MILADFELTWGCHCRQHLDVGHIFSRVLRSFHFYFVRSSIRNSAWFSLCTRCDRSRCRWILAVFRVVAVVVDFGISCILTHSKRHLPSMADKRISLEQLNDLCVSMIIIIMIQCRRERQPHSMIPILFYVSMFIFIRVCYRLNDSQYQRNAASELLSFYVLQ